MRLLLPEARPLPDDELLDLYGTDRTSYLRAGFVLTTDGGIAVDGGSRGLQTPADLVAFRTLRAVSDAVVVGAGTARAEDYGRVRLRADAAAWRERRGLPEQVPLVVVSRSLDLDPAARCFACPAVVITCGAADPARRSALGAVADVVVAGDADVDLGAALAALHERGLRRLLCEGGPSLLTALLAEGLVDELCLTSTPLLLGTAPTLLTRALEHPVPLALEHLVDGGDGVLLGRWSVRR